MENLNYSVCQVISVGEFNNFQRLALAKHSFEFTREVVENFVTRLSYTATIHRGGFFFQKRA